MEEKVILDIQADNKKALSAIDKINKQLGVTEKQQKKNNSVFEKMGSILGGIAITAGLVSMAKHTINVASNLEEAENKLNAVFGGKGQALVNDFATRYRDALGMSVIQTKNFIADAGNLFTGFGMGAEKARLFSTDVLKLTNDLASFNNLSTEDAQRRMMSALMGESESAKGLGASILETQLKVASLDAGYGEYKNTMDENTKIQIRYHAILMQSKNAVGDSERSLNSYVGQSRRMSTAIETLSMTLGNKLLPTITSVISAIGTIVIAIEQNLAVIEAITVAVIAGATAWGIYTVAVNRVAIATRIATIAQTALNVVMRANPIGILVTGISALIGYLYYLMETSELTRFSFIYLWESMIDGFLSFSNLITSGINKIIEAYNYLATAVGAKPIKLIAQYEILGEEKIRALALAGSVLDKNKKIDKAKGLGGAVSSIPSSAGGSVPSSGGGAESDSYFQTFDKKGSSKSSGNSGTLNVGDITININKKDSEGDDALIDRLTYKIANEFNKAGKIAGVI